MLIHRIFTVVFFLLYGLVLTAQQDSASFHDGQPFGAKPLEYRWADSSVLVNSTTAHLKNVRVKNVLCIRDTGYNPTLRIAYKVPGKEQWIVFATPFINETNDFRWVNIDNSGQPELVVKGDMAYEAWPYGERRVTAMIIYRIDSVPVQIFYACLGCSEFHVGDHRTGDGKYNFTLDRKIEVKQGSLIISKLLIGKMNETEQDIFERWCHFTKLDPGVYILVKGKFVKQ
jgi:hypothetical protein